MAIQPISASFSAGHAAAAPVASPSESQQKFAGFLKDSLNGVMKSEANSNALTAKLVNGENIELHQVMAASQKSSIAMQLTIEVRNKAIEAYQETMRMQM